MSPVKQWSPTLLGLRTGLMNESFIVTEYAELSCWWNLALDYLTMHN